MLARDDNSTLKTTPLHALHVASGGKMVPFAGYEMPVQFAPGVLREHLHTRDAAGLFDVSHMGQIALRPKSGKLEDAALALERLVPQDILSVAPGRQRYTQLLNADGGRERRADFLHHRRLRRACAPGPKQRQECDRAARAGWRLCCAP